MDRIFKKISEGLEIFDTLYERYETTSSSSQRDKLESELKKEIKKLQRFREQVKNWQAMNEIKEKSQLNEYRQLVETAMEQYKVIEKGAKSKSYSMDDEDEDEETEAMKFVRDCLEEIERQEETLEAELDKLSASKRSKRHQKDDERRAEVDQALAHHKWHKEKLELILRLLENHVLREDDVLSLSDDLQYYLEDNQDPDFVHDDSMYDDLDLDADATIAQEVNPNLKDESSLFISGSSSPVLEPVTVTSSNTYSHRAGSISHADQSKPHTPRAPAAYVNHVPSPAAVAAAPHLSTRASNPSLATLKPAPVPKPATDIKWAAAVNAVRGQQSRSSSVTSTHAKTPERVPSALNVNALNAASVLEALKKQKPKESNSPISSKGSTPPSHSATPATSAHSLEKDTGMSDAESAVEADSTFRFLPPGIQGIILSAVVSQNSSGVEQTLATVLSVPRSFSPLPVNFYPEGLEAQRVSTLWNQLRQSPNLEIDAQNVDTSTLFYAYYYGLSLKERQVADAVLQSRQWVCRDETNAVWCQKRAEVTGDQADYNVFEARDWSMSEARL